MKKKTITIHHVIYMNTTLVLFLWILSITLASMLLSLFGWRINRSYSKHKEYRIKKGIDIVCKSIIAIWCWLAIVNIVSFGPLFVLSHILENIFYVVFTTLLIVFWLKRSYRKNKHSRNFMIILSVWNILIYCLSVVYLMALILNKRGSHVNRIPPAVRCHFG